MGRPTTGMGNDGEDQWGELQGRAVNLLWTATLSRGEEIVEWVSEGYSQSCGQFGQYVGYWLLLL